MCAKPVGRYVIFLAMAVTLMGAKCPGIPDSHDIVITVVTSEAIEMEFPAEGGLNAEAGSEIIDVAEIREEIEEAGIEIDLIQDIKVSAVEYGLVEYNEAFTDRRIIDAQVTVKRSDGGPSAVFIDDLDVDVFPLLGKLVPAPINGAGVEFINELLDDVLAALRAGTSADFQVIGTVSGVSDPPGRYTDFVWRVVIHYQIAGGFPTESPDF